MFTRSLLAGVVVLVCASVGEAQRFGFRPPTFRPPTPAPVVRPPAPVPVFRPVVTPGVGNHQPTGGETAGNFAAATPGGTPEWNKEQNAEPRPPDVVAKAPPPPVRNDENNGWWVWLAVGVLVLVVVALILWSLSETPEAPPPPLAVVPPQHVPETVLVRVVAPPSGEAPEWVREAWVGLILPAVDNRVVRGRGVLTGTRSFAPAYQVRSSIALELLEMGDRTAAAAWWRQHAPAATDPGEVFLFDPECCSRLG